MIAPEFGGEPWEPPFWSTYYASNAMIEMLLHTLSYVVLLMNCEVSLYSFYR